MLVWTRRRDSWTGNIRNLRFLSINFYCYHFITKRKGLLKRNKHKSNCFIRTECTSHETSSSLSILLLKSLLDNKEREREKEKQREREREKEGVEHCATPDSHGAQWPVYPRKKSVAENTKKYKRIKIVLWWRPDVIFSNAIALYSCYSVHILRKAYFDCILKYNMCIAISIQKTDCLTIVYVCA